MLFKRLESKIIFHSFIHSFISKDAFNWLEMTVKTFTMVQRISISNNWCSIFLSIHQGSWKPKWITVSTKKILSTVLQLFNIKYSNIKYSQNVSALITRNVYWTANQHIRMISEGSCDTEDWSNNAENSALHHMNKLYFKIYSDRKQSLWNVIIFHSITVLLYFWINKCSIKETAFKNVNNLTDPKF